MWNVSPELEKETEYFNEQFQYRIKHRWTRLPENCNQPSKLVTQVYCESCKSLVKVSSTLNKVSIYSLVFLKQDVKLCRLFHIAIQIDSQDMAA